MMLIPGAPTVDVLPTVQLDPVHTVPIAWATLDRGKYSWIWIVMTCPYCGKPHDHYGGPLDRAPRPTGVVIAAHCDINDRRQVAVDPTTSLSYVLIGD